MTELISSANRFTPPVPLNTAILFLVFNRPDTTRQVFDAIRQAKPPRLYVAADGPRVTREGEAERCATVRQIATVVDWKCEVFTLFREQNLGCGRAVSSAISWFFENEEQGIILEDDCLPSQSFFYYCEELLTRYSEDERVMCVSGDNFQRGQRVTNDSYYFSRYPHIWGWASWRRAWKHYDFDLEQWPSFRAARGLRSLSDGNKLFESYWKNIFDSAREIDTWDYQWTFSCWAQHGLTALPVVNQVTNIGFGSDSTHAMDAFSPLANLLALELRFPLKHPTTVFRNVKADSYTDRTQFRITGLHESKRMLSRLLAKMWNPPVGHRIK